MTGTFDRSFDVLKAAFDASRSTVFFGGAGVSTGSGIPDFRGTRGLYKNPPKEFSDPPEYLLSHTCLVREPEKFFAYYRSYMLTDGALPNAAHTSLAALEEAGKISAVVTQNIDGLHTLAGSRTVYELHGSTRKNHCASCGKRYPADVISRSVGVPHCDCGGMIRPDVVLYEEGLPDAAFSAAARAIADADVLIVGGTSLTVYPAAGLVRLFRGKCFAIVNLDETPYDGFADVVIREPVEDVLPLLL